MEKDLSFIKKQIKEMQSKHKPTTNKNVNFKILADIAKLRLGRIKEGEDYINNSTKMTFIDKLGNEFEMQPNNVKSGKWSPFESGTVRNPEYHMKQLQDIVSEKGGKIKDGEIYVNSQTKMTFIDKDGNEFKMSPSNLKGGKWSPFESGNVYNNTEYHMKQLQDIVSEKGGKIKDGELYINGRTKMIFIDKLGNEFQMIPNAVKQGRWSPYESGNVYNNPEYHIKQLQEIVSAKGGKIKDGEQYINSSTKMTFIDKFDNEFQMTPNSVKSGKWSPYEKNCSEHICRQIIEQLYDKKFPSTWNIIKREEGKNLQLDGYCQELKIAFEYQGEQHTTGWFFRDDKNKQEKSLMEITVRDTEKKQACKDLGILLLEINHYKKINNIEDIIAQTIVDVKKSYESHNQELPYFISILNINEIKVDLSKISHLVLMQKELDKIAIEKGGKIKEGEQYINSSTKMTFIDKFDNEFQMTPNKVKQGRWSPYESGRVFNNPEYHMKQLQDIVSKKGGRIKEGEVYIGANNKMTFIDKLDNEFEMSPSNLKSGQWSPFESGRVFNNTEYHMKQLQEIVSAKGGEIKDGEVYIGAKTKMAFVDKLGNEFQTTPDIIKANYKRKIN